MVKRKNLSGKKEDKAKMPVAQESEEEKEEEGFNPYASFKKEEPEKNSPEKEKPNEEEEEQKPR